MILDIPGMRNLTDDFEGDKELPVVRFRLLDVDENEHMEEEMERKHDGEEEVKEEGIHLNINNKDVDCYIPCSDDF